MFMAPPSDGLVGATAVIDSVGATFATVTVRGAAEYEPSSSLDPRQRERLWELVGGLAARGRAVVFSTHNVGEAERYADRLLVLADGEVLFTGTPAALERVVGGDHHDFEAAFVRFLHEHGH